MGRAAVLILAVAFSLAPGLAKTTPDAAARGLLHRLPPQR